MDWTDTAADSAHTVVANMVVLLGVGMFGWSASVLLVVYWVEAGVAIVRGAVQGLFAEHTPTELAIDHKLPLSSWADKRGGVSVWVLPPMYPRNIPVVVASIIVLVMFWPIVGVIVLATIEAGGSLVSPVSVGIGVVSLVIGHGVGFAEYVVSEQYTDLSVRSALLRRQVLSMFVLGVGGVIVFANTTPPAILLVVVVGVKLVGDIVFGQPERTDSLTEWDDSDSLERGIPDTEPIETFRLSRLSLLARQLGYIPLYLLVPPYLLVALVVVPAGLIGGRGIGVVAGIVAVVTTAIGLIVRQTVQTAYLEYHVYPDQIVAHDTLLDTPQWTVSRPNVTDVTIASSRLDGIRPGNRTVVVSIYDETYRIQGLRRPEAFVESIRK
ncbi:MAG: hypothetical protein A07HR60_02566 [uncultured archaeon A07HR60]|nr:MAG: hypothetical protein A07HR60_02566 [uncultured archaeon A07HR60]